MKHSITSIGIITPGLVLLSTFSILAPSCKKTETISNQPANEAIASAAIQNRNGFWHTKQYPSDVANTWFSLLTDVTKNKPYGSQQVLRILTYSGLALYESVVPGMPSYQSMYTYFTRNSITFDNKKNYYWPACANAAIARISSRIMQDYPTPNLTQVQALEAWLNVSFQSSTTPEQLQFSNEFGKYVADMIYDYSKTDGTFNPDGTLSVCAPYIPLGGPGNWVPTPPAFFPAAGACQGALRTFIPNIVNTVLFSPPPAYSTDPASAFYQAANEVYQSRNNITPDELRLVNNWRDILGTNYNPLAHGLKIATTIISKEKLNMEDAAVLYAKYAIVNFDAVVTAFYSKFHYPLIRPITYIRNIMGYATWNSTFNTPQTPSYPDELAITASAIVLLEHRFGSNYSFIDSTHKSLYGEWAYGSFSSLLDSLVQLRVNSGTSFRFGGEAGIVQGRAVGELVESLPFKKP